VTADNIFLLLQFSISNYVVDISYAFYVLQNTCFSWEVMNFQMKMRFVCEIYIIRTLVLIEKEIMG
jgi:hypothetical protein